MPLSKRRFFWRSFSRTKTLATSFDVPASKPFLKMIGII
jgi:hypothetical protein